MAEDPMPADIRRALRAVPMGRRGFLRLGGVGLAGAATAGLSGCGIFTGQQSGGAETLNWNIGAEVDDFDSATTTDSVSTSILNNINEGLYRLDEQENPQPAMAESVQVGPDELTYTFTLRDGIRWSNGEPVTSGDFRFAWLKAMDPETASQYAFIVADYVRGGAAYNAGEAGPEQVAIETPDDTTLRVTLANPTPYFLDLTTFRTYFPQPRAFVEQRGSDYAQGPATLLSNGPFRMTRYDPASGGTLQKNEQYWDADNVDIERINMRIVKEENTALRLYQSGQLDLTGLTGERVARFRDSPEFFRVVDFATFFAVMNQQDPAMANVNIRRALMLGFDRTLLTGSVLQDGSEPAYAFVPPGMAGPGEQTFRAVNGELITAAPGRARGFWDRGVRELGRTPTITLLFSDSSVARDIATFIQEQYRTNLGVEARLDITTFEAALERVDNREYQVSFGSGWVADYDDPLSFMQYFLGDSEFNRTGWSDQGYDRLVNGARSEPDEGARMRMMLQAEKILFRDAVLAPTYYNASVGLIKPYLNNYVTHPYGAGSEWKFARLEGK